MFANKKFRKVAILFLSLPFLSMMLLVGTPFAMAQGQDSFSGEDFEGMDMDFGEVGGEGRRFQIVPDCATRGAGGDAPSLECAMQTFENIAMLILGITGSFALLMFVYGGFMLLTSGGAEAKVSKGKEIIRNAVIGIVIILTSGYLIDYGLRKIAPGVQTPGAECGSGGVYVTKANGTCCECLAQCSGAGLSCVAEADTQDKECYGALPGCDAGTICCK